MPNPDELPSPSLQAGGNTDSGLPVGLSESDVEAGLSSSVMRNNIISTHRKLMPTAGSFKPALKF